MIRFLPFIAGIIIFLSIGFSHQACALPPAPQVPSGTEVGTTVRYFKSTDDLSWIAEVGQLNQTDNRQLQEATLGGYFQEFENLKLGAFLREARGLRHDDDWQKINGVWSWVDSRSRNESILILDATPRYMIEDQLLGELKIRLLDDFFDSEQTLQLRPGLTYFLLNKGQAFWNFFAQFEFDLPLNYGAKPMNERWIYLGALYHLTTSWSLGGFLAEHWQAWSSSSNYLASGGSSYVISSQATNLTALMIFEY